MPWIQGREWALTSLVLVLLCALSGAAGGGEEEVQRVQLVVQDALGMPLKAADALVHVEGPEVNQKPWGFRSRGQELVTPREILFYFHALPSLRPARSPDQVWPLRLEIEKGEAVVELPPSITRFWIDVSTKDVPGVGCLVAGPFLADVKRLILSIPKGTPFNGTLDLPVGVYPSEVEGLRVYAFPSRPHLQAVCPGFRWYPHAVSKRVAPDGSFIVHGLGRTTYRIEVIDVERRFARPDPIYDVVPSEWENLHIPLRRAVTVRVRIVRKDGSPVVDAPLRAGWRLPNGDVRDLSETPEIVDSTDAWTQYRTDAEGRVVIRGVDPERTYRMWAHADGHTRLFETRLSPKDEKILILEEGRPFED